MQLSLPDQLQDVINYFSRLPSVGEKTATRQTLALSSWRPEDLIRFGEALKSLVQINRCRECGFFSDFDLCHVCISPERTGNKTLCVVEGVTDYMAIEKSGNFKGCYHILGGVLSPLQGIGPEKLKINKLMNRIDDLNIAEVILAINPSVEGDATCAYIKQMLPAHVVAERIGFGIPVGGHIEYLDSLTISKALENKRLF